MTSRMRQAVPSRRAASSIVLALVALAGTGCGEADERPVIAKTKAPIASFAPLVVLDGRERSFPMATDDFLHHSALEWKGGSCPLEVNIAAGPASRRVAGEPLPALEPRRLGRTPPYAIRPREGTCRHPRRDRFTSDQHTRPFDVEDRPVDLTADEGFVLDVLRSAQPGRRRLTSGGSLADDVAVYYATEPTRVSRRPALRISYWLLFGRGETTTAADGRAIEHEGDWERIDVIAVQRSGGSRVYEPAAVRLRREGRFETVPWDAVELAGAPRTHPVVYLAPRSHTPAVSRPDGGRARAVRWRTWRRLRNVRDEAWYGYGGAWGVGGDEDGSTGPLGPSPFELDSPPPERLAASD